MLTNPARNAFASTPIKPEQPHVLIVYTGGTIGMVQNPVTGAHEPLDFSHLLSHVPELQNVGVNFNTIQFDPPLDSANMNPELWASLARVIVDNYERYDGFVILHGTDTMSYTAAALSYMLQNLTKPVILTGSQLPIGVLRTDGKENLITSIEIAASKDRIGQPIVPEVCIYFQGSLLRGNRAKKLSSEEFHAFTSPNYPPLARVGVHITWAYHHINHITHEGPITPYYEMGRDIVVLRLFPGITRETIEGILHIPSLRGVVLETYGAGNAMTYDWFLSALHDAVARGIIIVNVTQCLGGSVEMGIYETGNQLSKAGVIGSHDMTTEATIVKLMFLLGQGHTQKEIEELLLQNISGEISIQ